MGSGEDCLEEVTCGLRLTGERGGGAGPKGWGAGHGEECHPGTGLYAKKLEGGRSCECLEKVRPSVRGWGASVGVGQVNGTR